MSKPTLFVVLDIETTLRKRIAFDVAWTITDRKGGDFGSGSFVIREAFAHDVPFFKEKLGHYFDDAFARVITPATIEEVRDTFNAQINALAEARPYAAVLRAGRGQQAGPAGPGRPTRPGRS